MSLRDLVTGSDMCTPSGADGAGPSNAMGSLVNNLLGGASKTQEQLRELPSVHTGLHGPPPGLLTPEAAAMAAAAGPSGIHIPGVMPSRMDGPGGAHALLSSIAGPSASAATPAEWDAIFGGGASGPAMHGPMHAPPPPMHPQLGAPLPPGLSTHLQHFFKGGRLQGMPPGAMMQAPPLAPQMAAALSVADKVRIRDRATILSRHVYADQGDAFADQQVGALLAALHINPAELPGEMPHVHDAAWHEVWAQQQQRGGPMIGHDIAAGAAEAAGNWDAIWSAGPMPHRPMHHSGMAGPALSTGWASEFAAEAAVAQAQPQNAWASEFVASGAAGPAAAADALADEFSAEQAAAQVAAQEGRQHTTNPADAMRSTRALVDVLSADPDPKMRASKFLQFVSKMSKGELILEDNKVVERPAGALGADWASDFQQQQQGSGAASTSAAQGSAGLQGTAWVEEFAGKLAGGLDLGADEELERAWRAQVSEEEAAARERESAWVSEFAGGDEDTFQEWERIYGLGHVEESAMGPWGAVRPKGQYVFAENNPFLGDESALAKGKDLFKRGVLTEAALALEAEVQARPNNAEAWRLLGTVHAENDDDQQAIAAMLNALKADPRDPEVLLALGVSHTNELDTGEAVGHLASWLSGHPQYGDVAREFGGPPDSSQALSHLVRTFEAATQRFPGDAELQVALGVLHHLGRQYTAAINAFEAALRLRPQDYSLWNKLGATLANNARSAEALGAYQKALDLKPNYMRAWTNMGISFANIGEYEKSARFYVRALQLNPSASHVWGYLRTSLACAGRMELMGAVDSMDVNALGSALPLE